MSSKGESGYGVVAWRFLVLLCVSMVGFAQNLAWFTFGAFPQQTMTFYDVSQFWVSFTLVLGPIGYIAVFWLVLIFLDKRGLRLICVGSALATFMCSVFRVPTVFFPRHPAAFPLVLIGQFCNALAGPAAMAIPAKMSSMWFSEGRPLSTAVAVLSNSLGAAIGFLLALMVKSGSDIPLQLYLQGGLALLSLVFSLLFARDAPPRPSSLATHRDVSSVAVLPALLAMTKQGALWLLVMAAGVTQGVFSNWAALLGFLLADAEHPQIASWVGFAVILSSCVSGMLCGLVASKFRRALKLFIVTTFLAMHVLPFEHVVPCVNATSNTTINYFSSNSTLLSPSSSLCYSNYVSLMVLATLAAFLFNASMPLFFELSVEVAFPCPEGLVGSALGIVMNLIGFVMLFLVNYLSAFVMNWINMGTILAWGLVLLFLLRERYGRTAIDEKQPSDHHETKQLLVNVY